MTEFETKLLSGLTDIQNRVISMEKEQANTKAQLKEALAELETIKKHSNLERVELACTKAVKSNTPPESYFNNLNQNVVIGTEIMHDLDDKLSKRLNTIEGSVNGVMSRIK